MNNPSEIPAQDAAASRRRTIDIVNAGMGKRYAAERRFRWYGRFAIGLGLLFLALLFTSIVGNGYSAFMQTFVRLDITFDVGLLDPEGKRNAQQLATADYGGLIKKSLRETFPEVSQRRDKRALYALVSSGADFALRDLVLSDPGLIGTRQSVWVPADDDVDMFMKGHIDREAPQTDRRIKDNQLAWLDRLQTEGRIEKRFNTTFFTAGDSREPELAGIRSALTGSLLTLMVTLVLSFPIGVAAAVYLEEFAPQNRLTDIIEVNINNLAAVPSIVFGLLGLAVILKGSLPALLLGSLFALFGVYHGYAYGEAIVGAEQTPLLSYLLGFAVTQYAIIAGGVALVSALAARSARLQSLAVRSGAWFATVTGAVDDAPGQHQSPGRSVHENRTAGAHVILPVTGKQLVGDQFVRRFAVRNPQQRLGEVVAELVQQDEAEDLECAVPAKEAEERQPDGLAQALRCGDPAVISPALADAHSSPRS